MIPPFNDDGHLPPGIHLAALDEIASRFGVQSEIRRVQMESVRWMVDLAIRVGVRRIVLNGSFVTDIMEPNDVDCVILPAADAPRDREAAATIGAGLPFLEIDVVDEEGFSSLVDRFFATDRFGAAKGMVEVVL